MTDNVEVEIRYLKPINPPLNPMGDNRLREAFNKKLKDAFNQISGILDQYNVTAHQIRDVDQTMSATMAETDIEKLNSALKPHDFSVAKPEPLDWSMMLE